MDDTLSIKSRHGHYHNKGFWWIEPVLVNGKSSAFMVMFGADEIGDKTCYRIGGSLETWFEPASKDRTAIIRQGKALIRERLKGKKVALPDGKPYSWE
jgi:hypothetical protein